MDEQTLVELIKIRTKAKENNDECYESICELTDKIQTNNSNLYFKAKSIAKNS